MKNTTYQDRVVEQLIMWVNGKSIHNKFDNECCPDFSCCSPELFTADVSDRMTYLMTKLQKYGRHIDQS